MPDITRPSGEQLRFLSELTGNHILDTYLEAAERGGRTLADLMADLFNVSGDLEAFQFRLTAGVIEYRVGSGAWTEIADFTDLLTARDEAVAAAASVPNFTISTDPPSGGSDGDVWLMIT